MSLELYNKIIQDGYTDFKNEKYLWLDGMEWLPENSSVTVAKYDTIKPFAQDGGGNIWGICTDKKHKEKVVYCTHDDEECTLYAENLQKAIFRNIIDFLSEVSVCEEDAEGNDAEYEVSEIEKFIGRWIEFFSDYNDYFSQEWTTELSEMKEHRPVAQEGAFFYLPSENAEKLLNKFLSFKGIDKEYKPQNILLKDSDRHTLNIDETNIYFTKEVIEGLCCYCDESLKKYVNYYKTFCEKVENRAITETVIYKNSINDAYIFPIAKSLWEGSFSAGTKIKSEDNSKGDYTKYYFDNDNRLIFSEEYYKFTLKYKTFYHYSDENYVIKAIKFKIENNQVIFDSIYENTYDINNNLIGYILYNEYEIINAEHYFYDDKNKLKSSDTFFSFKYFESFGRITDKQSPDGRYYGKNNPMQVYQYKYFYEDVLNIVNWTRFTEKGIISSDYSIKEKAVKELKKKIKQAFL